MQFLQDVSAKAFSGFSPEYLLNPVEWHASAVGGNILNPLVANIFTQEIRLNIDGNQQTIIPGPLEAMDIIFDAATLQAETNWQVRLKQMF